MHKSPPDLGGIVVEINFAYEEVDLEYFGHDAYEVFKIVIEGGFWGTVIIIFLDLSLGSIDQHFDDFLL
jgi:hypothetical protein